MATPIPAGEYRAKLRFRLTGDAEEMICTLGLRNNEPGERDLNEVARAVYDAWTGAMPLGDQLNAYAFVGVDIQAGMATGADEQGTYNEIYQGGSSAAPLPQNCALLVKKKTAQAGRRNSGRMFVPPLALAESGVAANGVIDSGQLTDYQGKYNQFYDNLRDSTALPGAPETSFMPVIHHSAPVGEQPPLVLVSTDVTAFVVDQVIATQRRRLRR